MVIQLIIKDIDVFHGRKKVKMSRKLPTTISRLKELFERNLDSYSSSKYNETQVRREFIDPFFEALGWDVGNKEGIAEQYKEVIHEDSIIVGNSKKAPDYCFRVGSERKFFVEAKKPAVNISKDVDSAFQLRRYGWSAKLGLSILTNFKEISVYDCRVKPKQNDKASTARIMHFSFEELDEKWSELEDIFSKDAVWKGSFDKFSSISGKKRGTTTVDDDFLKQLEGWRASLAKNLVKLNKNINQRDLNYSVQRTIDRILFLRISEDRGLENDAQLQSLLSKKNIYKGLCELFLIADEKYNSGLFHFHKENDRPEPPDELSLKLNIDDKTLKEIFENLYYPNCPYEFSVMPAEILGQVYEQFLGKYIKVTSSKRVTIEEKPIVKKAGGVFYTPAYIVNEIVIETIAPLLKNSTPLKVSRLKFVDPACGSGSFLIGVYDYILNWHLDYYMSNNPKKHTDKVHLNKNRKWVLTSSEKKQILLNDIYGVDIDAQAVETTKLSLLLKVLENETHEAINKQLSLFKERALPDLGDNVKCGNSLVDSKFFNKYDHNQFGDDEMFKINPFDWKKEFPAVFKGNKKGFDAVVGNPPYVRVQLLNEIIPKQAEFFTSQYKSAQKGNYDIYVTFVERGLDILDANGVLGYILPHKFFNAEYGEPLREVLSSGKHVRKIVHFGDQQVFKQATTYTCLLYLTKMAKKKLEFEKVVNLNEWRLKRQAEKGIMSTKFLNSDSWYLLSDSERSLMNKLDKMDNTLESMTSRIFQGLKTSADKVYIVDKVKSKKKNYVIFCREDEKEYEVEKDLFHTLIKGGDSRDFIQKSSKRLILFPYGVREGNASILSEAELKKKYPLTYKYLKSHKVFLSGRERGNIVQGGNPWYVYGRTQALDQISKKKIFTPDIAPKPEFSVDQKGSTYFTGGVSGGYGILPNDDKYFYYLLGFLNSSFSNWFIRKTSTQMRGGFYSFESKYIKHIPVPIPTESQLKEINELVKGIISTSKSIEANSSGADNTLLARKRDRLKNAIDEIVYGALSLNKSEQSIVKTAGELLSQVS